MCPENETPPLDELLAGLRAGEERAAGDFVRRYEPLLRRVLRVTGVIRWAQSELESQDLAQSVFVQVIEAIRGGAVQFTDPAGLEGYLASAGRNRLRDHLRRLKAAKRDRQRTVAESAALAETPESSPSPSDVAAMREQVAQVEGCTPAADLEVLRAHADGVQWQELAASRDTTPEALRKRIDRVRERIRKTLGE